MRDSAPATNIRGASMNRVRIVSDGAQLRDQGRSKTDRMGPGDDRADEGSDVSLRLSAWLAAVSVEAALTAPAHDAATSVRVVADILPAPRSVH